MFVGLALTSWQVPVADKTHKLPTNTCFQFTFSKFHFLQHRHASSLPEYSLFTHRKPRPLLILHREKAFLRVNKLYLTHYCLLQRCYSVVAHMRYLWIPCITMSENPFFSVSSHLRCVSGNISNLTSTKCTSDTFNNILMTFVVSKSKCTQNMTKCI